AIPRRRRGERPPLPCAARARVRRRGDDGTRACGLSKEGESTVKCPVARVVVLLFASFATACVALDYDLASVPIPVSAKPAEAGSGEVVPFRVEARNVLWFDGLFGHTPPDVA